jgi:S-(hydroxymethyl)glutathione dehydrogenase / alcohol dehydrogenase
MQALVYHGRHDVRVEDRPDPRVVEPQDAVVRVTSTAICGSDLHIFNGLLPQPRPMVLGHEFMGIVEAVGPDVRRLKVGDRVIVPFPIACGTCWFCMHAMPTHCSSSNRMHYGPDGALTDQKGAGLYGYTDLYGGYDGGQAQFVRVPWADVGPRRVPDELSDEQVLFLTDILPTGWSALEWAEVKSGQTVAIFGAGPVGLMAAKLARVRGDVRVIAVDRVPERLEMARDKAGVDEIVDIRGEDPVARIRTLTDGRGADVCIDAVGMEAHQAPLGRVANMLHGQAGTLSALESALRAVRRGGTLSVVGVYGSDYDNFPLGRLFDKGVRLVSGQAPAQVCVDFLLELVADKRVRADDIVTHVLPLSDAPRAYRMFNQKSEGCVKVVLKPWA